MTNRNSFFFALSFSALMILSFTATEANERINLANIAKNLAPATFEEVSKVPDQPHFLRGYVRETDEWKQFLAVRKFSRTEGILGESLGRPLIDKSKKGYQPLSGDTAIFLNLVLGGKETRLAYPEHHVSPDGMHTFWSYTFGEKNLAEFSLLYKKYEIQWGVGKISDANWNDIKRVLGWAEFEAIHNFAIAMLQEGLSKTVKNYSEMMLTSRVLEKRSELLDDPEYANRLDEKIPGTGGLTNRDIVPVPLTRPEDFVPDLIIVTSSMFWGGFVNAYKVPGSEVISALSIQGLALQYMTGWSLVAHEFTHANSYLQGQPLSFYFDVEMWTALTNDISDSGVSDYLHAQYLAVIRDLARSYFGYDHKEVSRRIFKRGALGVSDIDEKEFREHAQKIRVIREEILSFVKDPKDGMMVNFYADPHFWLSVNTKFCDTAAVFRVLFALKYEPAGLFDPSNKDKEGNVKSAEVQTKEWLMQESGKISRLAKEAMKNTGSQSKFVDKSSKLNSEDLKCPVDSRLFGLDRKEKEELFEIAEMLFKKMESGDLLARVTLERMFGVIPPRFLKEVNSKDALDRIKEALK
ncbi:MAG: hypothetical protein Q8R36_04460 [bacterium]|nr:hypothetical protein [bacterium]